MFLLKVFRDLYTNGIHFKPSFFIRFDNKSSEGSSLE